MIRHSHYKGYAVHADAQPLHNGLYAANLEIEKLADRAHAARFAELDYFFEASQALAYATRWARMWIDHTQAPQAN
jgi:hypothetical protein